MSNENIIKPKQPIQKLITTLDFEIDIDNLYFPPAIFGRHENFLNNFHEAIKKSGYSASTEREGNENHGAHGKYSFDGVETTKYEKNKCLVYVGEQVSILDHTGTTGNYEESRKIKSITLNKKALNDVTLIITNYFLEERKRYQEILKKDKEILKKINSVISKLKSQQISE